MDINNANDNDTIDLKKLFSLMIEKKKIVIAIIVVCTLIATIVAFVLPKSYQSTTLVRVKSNNISSMAGYAAMAAGFGIDMSANSSSSPESYIELMKSREVLNPIIEKVDLTDEERNELKMEDFIKKYLEINNTKKTDLITIAAYGKTPEEAQMISQSVADNFLTLMTKLNKEGNSSTVNFLNDRMAIAKEEMETAENKIASLSAGKRKFILLMTKRKHSSNDSVPMI